MKTKIVHILAATVLSLHAAAASAQWAQLSSFQLWSTTYGDEKIRVVPVGVAVFNPSACPEPDSYFVPTTLPQESQRRIFATLLTAKTMARNAIVYLNGCESGRPALVTAYVE